MGRYSSSKMARLTESEWSLPDGAFLFREGEPGNEMFVIQEGEVRISTGAGNDEIVLATLGRGEFLGEMSVLEGMPRSANARAVGPTQVLVIGQGALLMRIRRDPTFAFELMKRLSGRVRSLNARLVEATGAAQRTDAGALP